MNEWGMQYRGSACELVKNIRQQVELVKNTRQQAELEKAEVQMHIQGNKQLDHSSPTFKPLMDSYIKSWISW